MIYYKASVFLSVWLLGVSAAASDDPYFDGEWRSSLTGCWTDPTCNRVMTVSHGGDWNYQYPYDSQPAFERAYMNSADAVKGDFRVTSDNIGVVMHSSPVKFYESFNCYGKKVEEMTAEECTQCKMAYTNYTFTTGMCDLLPFTYILITDSEDTVVPDMLAWAKDMVNVMYCVKESGDIPRAITTIIENGAQDRAFLEISVSEMLDIATASDGWDEVYYVIELKHHDDVSRYVISMHPFRFR